MANSQFPGPTSSLKSSQGQTGGRSSDQLPLPYSAMFLLYLNPFRMVSGDSRKVAHPYPSSRETVPWIWSPTSPSCTMSIFHLYMAILLSPKRVPQTFPEKLVEPHPSERETGVSLPFSCFSFRMIWTVVPPPTFCLTFPRMDSSDEPLGASTTPRDPIPLDVCPHCCECLWRPRSKTWLNWQRRIPLLQISLQTIPIS